MFEKKHKEQEMQELKNAIEDAQPQAYDDLEGYTPRPTHSFEPPEASAPLFVKVDKYKEIIRDVQEIKLFITGMKQLFDILHETDSVRQDATKVMRATLQRLEKSMIEVDSELLRPKGFDYTQVSGESVDVHRIEDSLTELQKQISALKGELEHMK